MKIFFCKRNPALNLLMYAINFPCILTISSSSDENGVKFLSRPVEKTPEQVSWLCKGSNISKVFPNVQLRHGLQAGNITNKGVVTNYHQCLGYCCQDKHCNVAVTLRNNCFLVACKTYTSCLPQEVPDKDYHSQVIYVNWEMPSEKILTKGWCKVAHIISRNHPYFEF